jgi:hypothetical protein
MIFRAATKRWLAVPDPKYIEIRLPYETLRASRFDRGGRQ